MIVVLILFGLHLFKAQIRITIMNALQDTPISPQTQT